VGALWATYFHGAESSSSLYASALPLVASCIAAAAATTTSIRVAGASRTLRVEVAFLHKHGSRAMAVETPG
jgi:hypothetical protein